MFEDRTPRESTMSSEEDELQPQKPIDDECRVTFIDFLADVMEFDLSSFPSAVFIELCSQCFNATRRYLEIQSQESYDYLANKVVRLLTGVTRPRYTDAPEGYEKILKIYRK